MGLDSVEFLLAVEDAFDISIANQAAEIMRTPGDVLDHVSARIVSGAPAPCLSMRAFHLLRRATIDALGVPRSAVRPSTDWRELLGDGRQRRQAWRAIGRSLGGARRDAALPCIRSLEPRATENFGSTAAHLAVVAAHAFLHDGEGWVRPQVEFVIGALLRQQFGIAKFDWDDEFVRDLGLD